MASYYAQIDENNIVIQVLAVSDASVFNPDGTDNEAAGQAYLQNHYGKFTRWMHTRFDGSKRKNYAGPGYTYDEMKDAFIPPKPFPSWTLNDESCLWEAPVTRPLDGKMYVWNETTHTWESS